MRFTIIMATYNRVEYVAEAIQSIIDQTFKDWEIIITDDASIDDTVRVIQSFDANIRVFGHLKNSGVGFCHHNSMKHAKGEIIVTLDSDDKLVPDALEKVDKMYRHHLDAGVVYSKLAFCDENMNPNGKTAGGLLQGSYYRWAKSHPHGSIVPALRTFKKSLYDKTEGYALYRNGEDKDILIKLEEAGAKFFFIDEVLYLYRRHNKSIGNTKKHDYMPQVMAAAKMRRRK